MLKIKSIYLVLIVALSLCTCGTILAQSGPAPTLTLTVTPGAASVYSRVFTAHLSYMPPTPSARPHVDFYNISGDVIFPLGSAPFDSTGTAVLTRDISPGAYTAQASTTINQIVIWSNKVPYKVP